MSADQISKRTRSGTKIRMSDVYRRVLRKPHLTEKEVDDMRRHVIRLAQALCEHVWGKGIH
jgi:hypothetical protein